MKAVVALVPAAGIGTRFGNALPKQYCLLLGKTVLYHTLTVLQASDFIKKIVLVLAPDDKIFDAKAYSFEKMYPLRLGGISRALTVKNALEFLQQQQLLQDNDWMLVHDAARCCLKLALLNRFIVAAQKQAQGALLALPVTDTLKHSTNENRVAATVERANLWQAQTPQMFPVSLLKEALNQADLGEVTDEASAVEALGYQPALVKGELSNFKLTFAQDLFLAEAILRAQKD